MSYTPPAIDALDFAFEPYTVPELDGLDFEFGFVAETLMHRWSAPVVLSIDQPAVRLRVEDEA